MNDIKDTKSVGARINTVLTYAVMIFFTVMAIYPLLWLVMNSFKTTTEFQMNKLGFPKEWVLVNYKDAWVRGKFPRLILNSFIYTGVTTVVTLVFSFMAGFAFAKIPNRATKYLHGSFVIGLLLTLQSIMVPLFLIINWVGLYNTFLGVLIPYIGIAMPMGIYLGTEFIKSIPDALVESARIDGATYLKIFISIIVPMAAPVAVTVAIMTVTGTWNEFMLINILTSSDALKSLPVGVQKFAGALSSDFGKQFAALVIGLVPMLVFYLSFRKEITKGVAAGAVKG
ncbi:MAG: carbohydrate ABC transporter permease [Sphaerochaeta sp.]|jgi:raffinose/stachyose/melibiose transport system permease protein|uniref:carbohydrate ABC transporter permease n=1 Tax=unclassified Sphaerochaeta TaxID=2637943 RepID=UPI000EC72F4D|nr:MULTISPECIES: carbohydrate ABC transporter permease [unclassified Sphaerochaeta]MCK9599192.1 carbohydrate ABC transporter permease [Sphaerochaeta sp.]MDX9823871.1 carbohydrate ABC transporter permease [Sphaerochaeta sp.]HAP56663.1 sugar ABC transporter permease [Sphaerochaeta sp.]HPE92259.1 carbohydrate ABC transporter permease [Sphaerochaeta sp.]